MNLSDHGRRVLSGAIGTGCERMAMEPVVEAARMTGAARPVPIVSGHIDGCLHHGDAGVPYCEKPADEGAWVAVPATKNVRIAESPRGGPGPAPRGAARNGVPADDVAPADGLHPELDLRAMELRARHKMIRALTALFENSP